MLWLSGSLAMNHVGVAVQLLAEELRVIADQFDEQVVARATQGLRRSISALSSSSDVSLSRAHQYFNLVIDLVNVEGSGTLLHIWRF